MRALLLSFVVLAGCTADSSNSRGALERATINVDPSTLVFFGLPINSYRMAAAGHDPAASTCVSVLFDFSNTGRKDTRHCEDFGAMFPYALVTTGVAHCRGTQEWAYAGNVEVRAARGCIDFGAPPGARIDMTLDVTGAPYTGEIAIHD